MSQEKNISTISIQGICVWSQAYDNAIVGDAIHTRTAPLEVKQNKTIQNSASAVPLPSPSHFGLPGIPDTANILREFIDLT